MWLDISRPLHRKTAVWPGDTALHASVKWDIAKGDTVTVHTLMSTVHLGTHADAPSHVQARGADISTLSIDRYIGKALVVDRPGLTPIQPRDLAPALAKKPPRLLIKTAISRLSESTFPSTFPYFTPDAAALLAKARIQLIGVDSPSVDAFSNKILEAHHTFFNAGIVILENLWLKDVTPGWYELVALPLRLKGFDASPVRAALRKIR